MGGTRYVRFGNKKGFTLIELVVVIAILAILAAIAIPVVISIIDSAAEASIKTKAASMDQACKTYYMGIKSGDINSSNFTPSQSGDKIPVKNDSLSNRVRCAKMGTIAGVLEYSGMYDLVGGLEDFGYDLSGNIHAFEENGSIPLTQLESDGSTTFMTLKYV